ADSAAGDARSPAGQATLLADLRGGRETRAAGRDPCRECLSSSGYAIGLADLLHRGLCGAGCCLPGGIVIAGMRGCVHQVPGTEGGAAGIGLHLATRAYVAADQVLARPADGGAVGGPRAHRHRAGECAADDHAMRWAALTGDVPETDGAFWFGRDAAVLD